MVNNNHLDRQGQIILDAVIQLLSWLTLSLNDAHNLIQIIADSTDLGSPSTLENPQPTTQIHLTASPIAQTPVLTVQTPAPTSQTLVPTAQTQSPTPLVVQTPVLTVQTPAPTVQTSVPTAQTQSPTPLVVQTLQPAVPPPVALLVLSLPNLPTTTIIVNGEERCQQQYNGFTFDIPHADTDGPFYLIN
ncbi:hypothetical protein F4604DRAFT_1916672 [Suillus subluteus]|nr:hypothetical protein F4604DRAFT_1916672 [Suillus subluteus]